MASEPDKQTEKMSTAAIEEARMVLPGIQALFGFQLMVVFNERFTRLSESEQLVHLAAAILVALSIAIIMTPAAYHRQAEQGSVSRFFVVLASTLVAAAMVPLMLGLCLEMYLLGRMIIGATGASLAIAGLLLSVFAGCWFVFPHMMRRRGRRGPSTADTDNRSGGLYEFRNQKLGQG